MNFINDTLNALRVELTDELDRNFKRNAFIDESRQQKLQQAIWSYI